MKPKKAAKAAAKQLKRKVQHIQKALRYLTQEALKGGI